MEQTWITKEEAKKMFPEKYDDKPLIPSYPFNFFREILNELPDSKIEIIPDDHNDKECASQMSDMINFKNNSKE